MRTEDQVRLSLQRRAKGVIPREDAWTEFQGRASRTGSHAGPSPSGRLAAATVALVVSAAGIGLAVRAFRTTDSIQPSGAVRNGKIAFASGAIYLVNPDGTGLQKVSQSPGSGIDTGPVWSPDGTKLAFSRSEGEYELRILDPATGSIVDPRGKEVDAAYSHTWSPDGTRIAFNYKNDLFLINADGTGLTRLGRGGSPSWSPDGTRIAFYDGLHVSVVNVDGSSETKVANGYWPAWSPSGSRIAFIDNATLQINVVNADGTDPMQLTEIPTDDIGQPMWSPDGSSIVFEALHDDNYDIYSVNADGTGFRNLTGESGDENVPTWSPDGTKIAFIAGEAVSENPGNTDTFDVYVMDSDGTNPTRLTDDTPPMYVLSWQAIPAYSGSQTSEPAVEAPASRPHASATIPVTTIDEGLVGHSRPARTARGPPC